MSNLLEQAISTDDGDRAAEIIRQALGIESDDVARYMFPNTWPADREQRALLTQKGTPDWRGKRIAGRWMLSLGRP